MTNMCKKIRSVVPVYRKLGKQFCYVIQTLPNFLFSTSLAAIRIVLWRSGGIQHAELSIASTTPVRANTSTDALWSWSSISMSVGKKSGPFIRK